MRKVEVLKIIYMNWKVDFIITKFEFNFAHGTFHSILHYILLIVYNDSRRCSIIINFTEDQLNFENVMNKKQWNMTYNTIKQKLF